MILIASGAYLQGEFASEVGLLPPSFLPIGNKRLYEHQIAFLKQANDQDDMFISIPATYQLDSFDSRQLKQLGVSIISVPEGLSLGDALIYCWNASGKHYDSFTLLHGDTLFLNASFKQSDAISIHPNKGFYKRATLGSDLTQLESVHDDWSNNCEQVISGFFKFSNPLLFMKSLIEAKTDFIQGIVNYHKIQPVKLISKGVWLDFGHINSFYHSRSRMTTQRVFNDLKIENRIVTKKSQENPVKIAAEGAWFQQLPLALRLFTPALLGLNQGEVNYVGASYQLEYLYLLPLSDLYVFSRLRKGCWDTVFTNISQMLQGFSRHRPKEVSMDDIERTNQIYLEKTLSRLTEYSQQNGMDSDELKDLAKKTAIYIKPATVADIGVVHGDLCFSNMLFDSRTEAVKCIDPRGLGINGELSIYGDIRYDLAKLYHSVIGLYDFIVAGRFQLIENNTFPKVVIACDETLHNEIVKSFTQLVLEPSGYEEKEILAITIHLFLSMLPLHSDRPERQKAFIANAIRLNKKLKEIE
jgi:hypothetical protein